MTVRFPAKRSNGSPNISAPDKTAHAGRGWRVRSKLLTVWLLARTARPAYRVSQHHFEGALVKRLILLIVCGVGVVALPVMAGSWRMRPTTRARDLVPANPALFASASASAAAACSSATLRG